MNFLSLQNARQNLSKDNYSTQELFWFYLFNFTITALQSLVYTTLVFSYLLVEYQFKDWIKTPHELNHLYSWWALSASIMGTLLFFLLLGLLYKTNKRTDGKHFLQRYMVLNTLIGLRILIFTGALLFIGTITIYALINIRIETFKGTIFTPEKLFDFLKRFIHHPFSLESVIPQEHHTSFFGQLFKTPAYIIQLPLLPGKIIMFLKDLRHFLLQLCPFLALAPLFLMTLQFHWVKVQLKKIGS